MLLHKTKFFKNNFFTSSKSHFDTFKNFTNSFNKKSLTFNKKLFNKGF